MDVDEGRVFEVALGEVLLLLGREIHLKDWHTGRVPVSLPVDAFGVEPGCRECFSESGMAAAELQCFEGPAFL